MTVEPRFAGAYVALLTPLADDGGVDSGAVDAHVERLLETGADGLLACGTTGEFADLDAAERAAVVAATVAAAGGRVPVLAGVGAVGATEACAHARAAADAGADGVLALPPLYWKLGPDGLVRHFTAIAGVTDLPLLAYDFPALAGTALTPPLVERLAREVGIAGIKLSGPELRTVRGVLDRVRPHRPDFAVFVGAAELALPALLAGAAGVIAAVANLTPEPFARMQQAVRDGDLSAAAAQQDQVHALLAVSALAAPPALGLKAAAAAWGSRLRPVVRTQPDGAEELVRTARELGRQLAGGPG